MEEEGALGIQSWGRYFRPPPLKGNLGLQLMSTVGERMTMSFLSEGHGGSYSRPAKGLHELSAMPIEYARDYWYHPNDENGKIHHLFSDHFHQQSNIFGAIPAASAGEIAAQTLPIEDLGAAQLDIVPLKKRSKKKAKKPGKSAGRRRSATKKLDMVINGIDLDLSGIPAPHCTCTGRPQQCYRWGAGGWQSACCTTSISVYPLPMSTKRRGARIAGRKMSQGAFKKVLEKLAGEGEDFSSPIDLKPLWAKHGTNKFVTIR